MEKKKNVGLFVVIGILILLVLVLVTLFGVLVWKSIGQRKEPGRSGQASGVQINRKDDDTLEDLHFAQSGYEFTVPGNYALTYTDVAGTVVYQDGVFQMRIGVVDDSYEKVMENPEEFTQPTVDAGGSIVQDMKETEVNGKRYAYYRATLQGESLIVIYTSAPNEEERIAGQIVLQGENVTDEDMLYMFASIASGAVKTDKADSTKDDIVVEMAEKKPSSIEMEWIAESSMQFGRAKVKHKVPENFYMEDTYEGLEYVTERYYMPEPYISVTCSVYDIPWYENVEDYIKRSMHFDDTKMRTMKIDGKKVYYVVETIMNDDKMLQQIYAGYDLGEQQFYVVEAYVIDEDMEFTMDTIREFLVIE